MEENIVDQMSSSLNEVPQEQQPIDSLTYRTFVSKFNEEYSNALSGEQKKLLEHYISSFADNGIELKVFLNEEISRLKEGLNRSKNKDDIKNDETLKENIDKVYNVLDRTKEKQIDVETLEIVLNTQQLLEDLERDDS